ncbi:hypothetical protein AQ490_22915 [Wenjunlia vitaminophila]|uniref:N-acetylmuramoyl-L-alanine amidase n=2 Tax=Wenjunlia vitaminophila TaxID=76728 RepID=A0A0T6LSF2_WENVI|nr:peptidoglycan recognition protein [Wenjunlia vitaminophila]KRV48732.1 hypothetical protein AQ490_22915 [Wenjunlia vitaminophila]
MTPSATAVAHRSTYRAEQGRTVARPPVLPGTTRTVPLAPLPKDRRGLAAPQHPAATHGLPARKVAPFSLLGVTWDDPSAAPPQAVQVRTRSAGGAWSPWQALETHTSDAPAAEVDAGPLRGSTMPLWVGRSDAVEVRVAPRRAAVPEGLRLELVDPGSDEPSRGSVPELRSRQGVAWSSGTHRVVDRPRFDEAEDPTEPAEPTEPKEPFEPGGTEDWSDVEEMLEGSEPSGSEASEKETSEKETSENEASEHEPSKESGHRPTTPGGSGRPHQEPRPSHPEPGPRPSSDANVTTGRVAAHPKIVSRAGWGADEKLRERGFRYTKRVKVAFVHHSATGNYYSCSQVPSMIRSIYRYHVKSNGWRDIGYNFLIDKCGTIYEGRAGGVSKPVMGAHSLGFNHNSTGVVLLGSYNSASPPKAALKSLAKLTAWKLGLSGVDPRSSVRMRSSGGKYGKGTVVTVKVVSGHRDVFGTDCPGDRLYARLGWVRTVAAKLQRH